MNNLNELIEAYMRQPDAIYGSCVIQLRYKRAQDKEWTYSNEFLQYNGNRDEFVWLNDWWEGEECVEYLGVLELDDIPDSMFWRPNGT